MAKLRLAARALALWLSVLALAGAAHAVALPFHATLSLQFGVSHIVNTFSVSGSGVGTSNGLGGTATLPASVFPLAGDQVVASPPYTAIQGFALGAKGLRQQGLFRVPLPGGSSLGFSFDGTAGTMGLAASGYFVNGIGVAFQNVPLAKVGAGGTSPVYLLGLVDGTVFGNPYQLGMATVSGAILSAPLAVLMATGFDARTLAGIGTLQLVSPAVLEGSSLGDMPIMLTLRVTFVPEPGTALLLGAGLAALASLSRRRTAQLG